MDFRDSLEEATFRGAARVWLGDHAEPREEGENELKAYTTFEHSTPEDEHAWVAACRAWQRTKHDGGFSAISWPRDAGGRGGSVMEQIIFDQEEAKFRVATGAFSVTLGMVAPTILRHGTEQQKVHVPRMLSGDELWCQLFSEPGAGSDLAGLQTRAVRRGDGWVVKGQKVWTSMAHCADWGYLLCRTDPSVPKHRGLTAFLLPMDAPGITVRPLRQMTGTASFNEVFLDDVVLADDLRLGPCGEGWHVAITTLMNERSSYTSKAPGPGAFEALVALARARDLNRDPLIRQRLAELYGLMQAHRYSSYRSLTAVSKGGVPGPEGSVSKLAVVRILRLMSDLALSLEGPAGTLDGAWTPFVLGSPGIRLGGGTDEILRNIIGERVLGLPAEPRLEKPVTPESSSEGIAVSQR